MLDHTEVKLYCDVDMYETFYIDSTGHMYTKIFNCVTDTSHVIDNDTGEKLPAFDNSQLCAVITHKG